MGTTVINKKKEQKKTEQIKKKKNKEPQLWFCSNYNLEILSLLKLLKFSAVFFRRFSIQLVLLSIVLAKPDED